MIKLADIWHNLQLNKIQSPCKIGKESEIEWASEKKYASITELWNSLACFPRKEDFMVDTIK